MGRFKYILLGVLLSSGIAWGLIEWNNVIFKGSTTFSALTASTVPYLNSSKVLNSSAVSDTELGYLDNVTSAIQTQLDAKVAKSTLTTKGDIYVATGSATVVRQAVGADGTFLKADSGQTNGISWATPGSTLSTVTRDTTDTVDSSEDLVFLTASGGTWTETLYTAVGNTGKILRLIKTADDATAVTIDANSTETIGGATTIQLVKIGDRLTLISDGSNWQILEDKITTLTHYHTANGWGSTATKIPKFSTNAETVGNTFTVANDATNGFSVTINVDGNFCFEFAHNASGGEQIGITLNSAQLTTSLWSATASTLMSSSQSSSADVTNQVSWCGRLSRNDVIRPHTAGTSASSVPERGHFWAQRM